MFLGRLLALVVVVVATLLASLAPAPVAGEAVSAVTRAAGDDGSSIAPDLRFPAAGPSVAAAWDVSVRHWGGMPCDGEVELVWTRLDASTNARASWYNPTDAWNNAGENFDCKVEFNSEMEYDWAKFCTVLAHEAGHLLGRQHVSGDLLMDPMFSRPLPLCEQTPDPAAPAPAPAAAPEVDETAIVASTVRRPRGARPRWVAPDARSAKVAGTTAAAPRCLTKRRRAGGRGVRRFACVRGNDAAAPAPRRRGWQAR